ncbi:uncharacterized protein LOC130656677 [Hydractinia symbiolongicarpus]|uniref:uncharacterized protein LOC130656677 n=1 Tax=Hydractinia symbiolongicarpus TaxID=13093 RepID=UPI00254E68F4|nr:uncharacterized protein LOC130656677 [Hydractinia symbiolongicarpus]
MAANSVVIISSSDEEGELDTTVSNQKQNKGKKYIRDKEDDFVTLLSMFGKILKDEKRLKLLCKMRNLAPENFKSSDEFLLFIRTVILELKESPETGNALLLMTSVCQTLDVRKVMWSSLKKKPGKERLSKTRLMETDVEKLSQNFSTSTETRNATSPIKDAAIINSSKGSNCDHNVNATKPDSAKLDTAKLDNTKTVSTKPVSAIGKMNMDALSKQKLTFNPRSIENMAKKLKRNQTNFVEECLKQSREKTAPTVIPKLSNISPCTVSLNDMKIVHPESENKISYDKKFKTTSQVRTKQSSASNKNEGSMEKTSKSLSRDISACSSSTKAPMEESNQPSKLSRSVSPPCVIVLDDDDNDEAQPTQLTILRQHGMKPRMDRQKPGDVSPKKMSKKTKIKLLAKKLEFMEKQIATYNEQELSLKDMSSDESVYLLESKLKEKFLKTWRRYCVLVGEDPDVIVATKRKIKVTSSPFPEINRSVQNYINRTGSFPNLFEIKQVCLQANDKHQLDLKLNDLHHCAVDVFTEVGRKLQKNREKESRQNGGNLLTDKVKLEDDPALYDDNLKRKLKHNRKLAKKRTDEVFTDFVRQQFEQESCANHAGEDSESSESDHLEETLEKLRKKDLIRNKELKRELVGKKASLPPSKKVRKDKTVISVTVSSSQEVDEVNKKVDYMVTIDSPLTKSKKLKLPPRRENSPRLFELDHLTSSSNDSNIPSMHTPPISCTSSGKSSKTELKPSTNDRAKVKPLTFTHPSPSFFKESTFQSAQHQEHARKAGPSSYSNYYSKKAKQSANVTTDNEREENENIVKTLFTELEETKKKKKSPASYYSQKEKISSILKGIELEKNKSSVLNGIELERNKSSVLKGIEFEKNKGIDNTPSFDSKQEENERTSKLPYDRSALHTNSSKRSLTDKNILGITKTNNENEYSNYTSPLRKFRNKNTEDVTQARQTKLNVVVISDDEDE